MVPKVIRMCQYYKSFSAWLRHVPRIMNTVADYFKHIEQGQDETLEPEHLAVAAFYCDVYDECDAELLSEDLSQYIEEYFVKLELNEARVSANAAKETLEQVDDLIKQCHGKGMLHHGVRRT